MHEHLRWIPKYTLVFGLGIGTLGCRNRHADHAYSDESPLGPSFWLNPVPSDDDALLGRSLARAPEASRTLEEQSFANPCAQSLASARESTTENHYENIVSAETGARGGAMLAAYGFGADVSVASHLIYRVDTTRRITRFDTTEYAQCCSTQDCGWGYVSGLIYGEGSYSSGKETSVDVAGNYTVIHAGASRKFSLLSTRKVRGYLAAIITPHDRTDSATRCPEGQQWTKVSCVSSKKVRMAEYACAEGMGVGPEATEEERSEADRMQREACAWLSLHGLPVPEVAAPSTESGEPEAEPIEP